MVYCEQSMCESKLGKLMQAFRADRPDEWSMDEFIGMAEDMNKAKDKLEQMNQELLAKLEQCAKELAWMIDKHNEQNMEDGSWKYDHQTPWEAMQLVVKAKGGAV